MLFRFRSLFFFMIYIQCIHMKTSSCRLAYLCENNLAAYKPSFFSSVSLLVFLFLFIKTSFFYFFLSYDCFVVISFHDSFFYALLAVILLFLSILRPYFSRALFSLIFLSIRIGDGIIDICKSRFYFLFSFTVVFIPPVVFFF